MVPTLYDGNNNPLRAMTYDSNGNRKSVYSIVPIALNSNGSNFAEEASRTQIFGYNPSSELTSDESSSAATSASHYNNAYSTPFTPDAAFNLGAANVDNQLNALLYDDHGNQTGYYPVNTPACGNVNGSPSPRPLTFDTENRLTSAPACTAIMTFGYDGDGLRIWKTATSNFFNGTAPTTTYFLYDGDDPVIELDSSGNVTAANGYAADGIRSRYNPADQSFLTYTFDPQGNVVQRLRTDSTGATDILDTALYTPYGVKLKDEALNSEA